MAVFDEAAVAVGEGEGAGEREFTPVAVVRLGIEPHRIRQRIIDKADGCALGAVGDRVAPA